MYRVYLSENVKEIYPRFLKLKFGQIKSEIRIFPLEENKIVFKTLSRIFFEFLILYEASRVTKECQNDSKLLVVKEDQIAILNKPSEQLYSTSKLKENYEGWAKKAPQNHVPILSFYAFVWRKLKILVNMFFYVVSFDRNSMIMIQNATKMVMFNVGEFNNGFDHITRSRTN